MFRVILSVALLFSLSGCMGSEKGIDSGWGLDAFNTQSKESKEEEQWFNSFYGKNHCHGQWASDCKPGEEAGGSGGFWGWQSDSSSQAD